MIGVTAFLAAASAPMVSAAALSPRGAGAAYITPHDEYSSSAGVLGCKINTNRVAYWPSAVSCDDICVKVSYAERWVYLLKIDSSTGAHDISHDAWNHLLSDTSPKEDLLVGRDMDYKFVHPSNCIHLLDNNGKVPLTAANSMNYLSGCLRKPNSYVAMNYILYNIYDTVCKYGWDEVCTIDLAVSNQASCAHTLGDTSHLLK